MPSRGRKKSGRKSAFLPLSAHSALGAQLLETLQAQFMIQNDSTKQNTMEDRYLNSMKALRAQHACVSRMLREESTTNALLIMVLQTERAARKIAEGWPSPDLLSKNFTLVQNTNDLLIQPRYRFTDRTSPPCSLSPRAGHFGHDLLWRTNCAKFGQFATSTKT